METSGNDELALHRTGKHETEIEPTEVWITQGRPFTNIRVENLNIQPKTETVDVETKSEDSKCEFNTKGIKFSFPNSDFEIESKKIEINDEDENCLFLPDSFSISNQEKKVEINPTSFLIETEEEEKVEMANSIISFKDSSSSFELNSSGFGWKDEKFFNFPHPNQIVSQYTLNSGIDVPGLFSMDGELDTSRGTDFYEYQHQHFPIYLCDFKVNEAPDPQIFRPKIHFGTDETRRNIKFKINSSFPLVKLRIGYFFPNSVGFVIPNVISSPSEWSAEKTSFSSQLIRGSVEIENEEEIFVLKRFTSVPVFSSALINYELTYEESNPGIVGTLVIDFFYKIINFFLNE